MSAKIVAVNLSVPCQRLRHAPTVAQTTPKSNNKEIQMSCKFCEKDRAGLSKISIYSESKEHCLFLNQEDELACFELDNYDSGRYFNIKFCPECGQRLKLASEKIARRMAKIASLKLVGKLNKERDKIIIIDRQNLKEELNEILKQIDDPGAEAAIRKALDGKVSLF